MIKLAIIGVGLIGGSLGLCLKNKLGEEIFITGLCKSEKSMQLAKNLGAVDFASSDIEKVVSDADIIYLSPPVLQIVPMVKKILPYVKSGAILTDAGSTKNCIIGIIILVCLVLAILIALPMLSIYDFI